MKVIIKKVRNAATVLAILSLTTSCSSGKEVTNEAYLRIEGPTELSVSEGGTTQDYVVQSNGQWEIIRKSIQTWAEAKPASGQNDGSFRITVGENKSGANRSLSFSFMLDGNELQETISVVQEGNPDGDGDGDDDDDDDDDCDDCPLYTAKRIWNLGAHNAFTDLIEYGGKYFCVFREAGAHVPKKPEDDGKIRILVSTDGDTWESAALIAKTGYDFRDPKLSTTSDGRLMVLFGGAVYQDGQKLSHNDHVSFSQDNEAKSFTEPQPITFGAGLPSLGKWLWRVTWDKNTGYGVVYETGPGVSYSASNIYLVATSDGIHYTLVDKLAVSGRPNESTVELLKDGRMRIIVRNEDKKGYLGYSGNSYTDWKWSDLGIQLGGPDIITLPNGKTVIGSRSFRDGGTYTSLFELDNNTGKVRELLELPSGGDTSYTGFIVVGNELWVSYYSEHEGKTSIYFAKVRYKKLFNQ